MKFVHFPKKWVRVPAGNYLSHVPPPNILTDVITRYQQGTKATCLIHSFASACYYLGWKESANKLATLHHKFVNRDFDCQLELLKTVVEKKVQEINSSRVQKFSLKKPLNILGEYSKHPTVLIPLGSDQGTQHAVTVVGDFIFDSNSQFALRRNKEALDWCTNSKNGFIKVYAALRFTAHPSKYKANKNLRARKKKKRKAIEGEDKAIEKNKKPRKVEINIVNHTSD